MYASSYVDVNTCNEILHVGKYKIEQVQIMLLYWINVIIVSKIAYHQTGCQGGDSTAS